MRRRQLGLEILRFARDGAAGRLARGRRAGRRCAGRDRARRRAIGSGRAAFLLAGPVLGALVGAGARPVVPARRRRPSIATTSSRTGPCRRSTSSAAAQPTPVHALQVADAEQHLARPRPAPGGSVPHPGGHAVCAGGARPGARPPALAAAAASFRPSRPSRSRPSWPPPTRPRRAWKTFEEAAKKENDPKLKELVQKLTETIQEMKQPGVDTKEALAKLSEMQAAIAAQQAQFNVGLVDAQMQALGEAMASTQALEGAGQALQQGKYDKAAEQLEKAEPKFDRKEAKTLKEKLAQAAKAMEEAGLADLSTATTELAESLDDDGDRPGRLQEARQPGPQPGPPQADQRPAHARSAVTSPSARATARRTARPRSAAQEVGQAQRATGAWPSAATPTATRTKLDSARKREQVQGQMGEGDVRDRDDPHARRPADRRADLPRAVPEVSPHDRGRPQFRADSAGPPPDDPPLLRADSPPGRRGREGRRSQARGRARLGTIIDLVPALRVGRPFQRPAR